MKTQILSDLSLPRSIEFSRLDPPPSMSTFVEVSRQGFDAAYVVNTSSTEEPQISLITPNNQRVTIYFSKEAEIAIRGFNLFYNPHHVIDYESPPCESSDNGKHQWQEKLNLTTLIQVKCINCGYEKFFATEEVRKRLTS